MSLKAQLEILIHLESFRNINIYHQGIYVMRARIYQQLADGTIISAHPYRIVEFDDTQIREKMKQKYKLSSDLYDHYFFSKAFMIKYMDEMVDLDDICHFRAEIDSYPNYNEDNFFFRIDLMFADISTTTSEQNTLNDPDKSGFKVVATFESLVHNSIKGIREYVPVYFNELYYSQVNVTLHTALISNIQNKALKYDYQFRYIPPKINENEKQKKVQQAPKPENFEQFFNVITNQYIIKIELTQFNNVILIVQPNLVDDIYNTYVGSLRFDHNKFLKFYQEQAQKLIKNEVKLQEFLEKIQDPPLPDYLQNIYKNDFQNINKSIDKPQENTLPEKAQSDTNLSTKASEEFKGNDESLNSLNDTSENLLSKPEEKNSTSNSLNDKTVSEQSSVHQQNPLFNQEEKKQNSNSLNDSSVSESSVVHSQNLSLQEEKKLYYSSYYDIRKAKISLQFDLSNDAIRRVLVSEIQREINTLAGCQFLLWNQYVELLRQNTIRFTKNLLDDYQIKINDQWGQSIFRYPIVVNELYNYCESKTGKAHVKQAKKYRKTECFKNREPLNVEDLNLFPKAKIHPIIFHEVYTKSKDAFDLADNQSLTFKSEAHVIVLVHGFQGSSYDLRLFSNNITIRHPDAVFLHSSCNEDNTDGDISVMGIKLADEVKKFISSQLYGRKLKRLSFVGHSLGGLIMRAALPQLDQFQDAFFTFLTFSSPHMGFCFSQSKMVDAGLWFMKAWNKTQSLKQMTLADSKNIKETFIYKLAQSSNLSKFKHIVLCSSPQDQYVPFHSARMQQTNKQSSDSKLSAVYDEMLKNIFKNITVDRIHRVDVSFEIPGKMVDNLIGRAAHIQFLENEALMKMLLSDLKYIFI